jgi:hypothetical protein
MSPTQNMDQAAGNDWSNPPYPMLHELISVDPMRSIDFSYANSMFEDVERQMRASEAEFCNSIKVLREKYVFNNPEAVDCFIRSHRVVAPLLIEAAPQFAAAFDNNALLALEIMPDDETPHSIYVLALWNRESAKARTALHSFDEGWLSRNFQATNGRIVFDYELI